MRPYGTGCGGGGFVVFCWWSDVFAGVGAHGCAPLRYGGRRGWFVVFCWCSDVFAGVGAHGCAPLRGTGGGLEGGVVWWGDAAVGGGFVGGSYLEEGGFAAGVGAED